MLLASSTALLLPPPPPCFPSSIKGSSRSQFTRRYAGNFGGREGVERVMLWDARRAIIRTLTDGSLSKESHDPDARILDATLQVIRLFSATIAVYAQQWRTRGFLIGPPLCNRPTFLENTPVLFFEQRVATRSKSRSNSGGYVRERAKDECNRGRPQPVGATRGGKEKRWWRQWIEVLWGGTKRASLLI